MVIALADFSQKIRAAALEFLMTEFPVFRLDILSSITNSKRIRLDFAESVKVELTNEGTEIIVFEELTCMYCKPVTVRNV